VPTLRWDRTPEILPGLHQQIQAPITNTILKLTFLQ
jgi:hypothetical protein